MFNIARIFGFVLSLTLIAVQLVASTADSPEHDMDIRSLHILDKRFSSYNITYNSNCQTICNGVNDARCSRAAPGAATIACECSTQTLQERAQCAYCVYYDPDQRSRLMVNGSAVNYTDYGKALFTDCANYNIRFPSATITSILLSVTETAGTGQIPSSISVSTTPTPIPGTTIASTVFSTASPSPTIRPNNGAAMITGGHMIGSAISAGFCMMVVAFFAG